MIGKKVWLSYLLYALCVPAYMMLAYYTNRSDLTQLLLLFGFLGLLYIGLLKFTNEDPKEGIIAGMGFRLLMLACIPALSDDFVRFIWDGRLMVGGENPFLHLPVYYLQHPELNIPGIHKALFDELNSQNYFTVYPALSQFLYAASAWLFQEHMFRNIIMIRLVLILADLGNIYLIGKLITHFKMPRRAVLLYALNPLVIVELAGNLHFEGLMMFFVLLAVWLLVTKRNHLSALAFSMAIGVKLLPLIFLPFFIKRLGWQRTSIYFGITAMGVVLLFLPFLSMALIHNMFSSVQLYFQSFEINASVYYMLRWIGQQIMGYNPIGFLGKVLPLVTLLALVLLAIREKYVGWDAFMKTSLFALSIYFFMSSIVHPWYLCSLVLLSVFTPYRYAAIWSLMIPLSYATYLYFPYRDNLWLVGLEYFIVLAWMVYESWVRTKWRRVERLMGSSLKDRAFF